MIWIDNKTLDPYFLIRKDIDVELDDIIPMSGSWANWGVLTMYTMTSTMIRPWSLSVLTVVSSELADLCKSPSRCVDLTISQSNLFFEKLGKCRSDMWVAIRHWNSPIHNGVAK